MVGIMGDFATCFLTAIEKNLMSSLLSFWQFRNNHFTLILRMEYDIANTKSHRQHVANGVIFFSLCNSHRLSWFVLLMFSEGTFCRFM